ncbi:hypothetical protein PPYR_02053 [Photinus pyralis]|uniref:PiggyBac transposable element-derived protein domain-containing protein n=1 Tax=Photinus pyralis TaxID=7054 RepID=A0A5N4B6B0_PHOPY|nr:hypothetical protein PPYR_02053 [Photinus pyralis]
MENIGVLGRGTRKSKCTQQTSTAGTNGLTDDEDCDYDDLATTEIPEDVPGTVDLFIRPEYDDSEWSSSDDEMLDVKRRKLQKISQKPNKKKPDDDINVASWVKSDAVYPPPNFINISDGVKLRQQKVMEDIKNLNPHLVDQSMLYAQQHNRHDFVVSSDEIRAFIGILLLTGYHKLPRERLYWGLDEDIRIDAVSRCLSRNRFEEIKRYLHLADNSTANSSNDKMHKVRPLMNLINKNFQQWGVFHQDLSVDEAMIKYFGHHPAKQFIRGKPVRFGFKDWMLCSYNGYCYKFDTYCGKSDSNTNDQLLFTRYVTRHYLRITNRTQVTRNKPTVPSSIAKDSLGHYPRKLPNQLRCAVLSFSDSLEL